MTARRPLKRFYKHAVAQTIGGGFTVELDGRRLRTPKGTPFALPSRALAEAVAAEWQGQGEKVDPQAMPLTGLANAAIDHVSADPNRFVDQIISYAACDLLCYRAEAPPRLVERQSELWDPVLAWAAERWSAQLCITSGLMPRKQPDEALAAIRRAVAGRDVFSLAALFSAVTLTGSTLLGLALVEHWLSAERAWAAARVDEIVQAEDWGLDHEAEARAARLGQELKSVEQFLRQLAG